MSRNWTFMALVVLALAIFIFVVSYGLLPPASVAKGKGTFGPWVFTWSMILVIEAGAVGLAWYLFTVNRSAEYGTFRWHPRGSCRG